MWPGAWAVLSCRAPVRRGSTTRLAKGGGGTRVVAAGPVAAPGGAASRRAYDTNTCLACPHEHMAERRGRGDARGRGG